MPTLTPIPDSFLTVRVQQTQVMPSLCGLCVGYERNEWRITQFAQHVFEWLPEFALTPSEWQSMQHANSVKLMRRAAQQVYKSKKFAKRGEFGELLLHAIVRQVHNSIPAISKIFYKTADNDTVKGFDAVHVVGSPDDLELWLGEAKFYNRIGAAIRDVVAELEVHTDTDYLRAEFNLIVGKLDDAVPHTEKLKKLLSPNTSLDEVFNRVCIPVLLTYDSECIANHTSCCQNYEAAFKAELEMNHGKFIKAISKKKGIPKDVTIHLFLLPLAEKKKLVEAFDERLKTWQKI
jgi:hypothetical protein